MKCFDMCEESLVHTNVVDEVRKEMIGEDETIMLQELFKALGDSTRIKIIFALSKRELCVCDISSIIDMSQSAVSHQLRVLRNLKLVKFRKEGKVVYYSLDDNHVLQLFNQGLDHVRHE